MTDSHIGPGQIFYKLADLLATLRDGGATNLQIAVGEHFPDVPFQRARVLVFSLFGECAERIHLSPFPAGRASEISARIANWQESFMHASGTSVCREFWGQFGAKESVELMRSYGDTVGVSMVARDADLDRQAFLSDTRHLLDNLVELELPDYAARVLYLKMTSLVRIIETCSEYTDDEIRRRIKSIYADFCAEFAEHDKGHEKAWETMTRWAKKGIMPTGLLCLGLTADVITIAGYIGGVAAQKLLPSP